MSEALVEGAEALHALNFARCLPYGCFMARPIQHRRLVALFFLSAVANCGTNQHQGEQAEATARATRLSLVAIAMDGGGAVSGTCNPNDSFSEPAASSGGNVVGCQGGWAQRLSADGEVDLHQGCFTRYSPHFDELLATQCRTYSEVHRTLLPEDWATAKKRILAASPLRLRSVGCNDPGIACPSDFGTPSLTVVVGGSTNTISWPSGARGLPSDLQTVVDELKRLGLVFP